MDAAYPPETSSGRLHGLSGLMSFVPFAILPVASALMLGNSGLGKTGKWLCLGFGLGSGLSSVLMMPLLEAGYAGLAQRLTLAFFSAWMITAVFRIVSLYEEETIREELA